MNDEDIEEMLIEFWHSDGWDLEGRARAQLLRIRMALAEDLRVAAELNPFAPGGVETYNAMQKAADIIRDGRKWTQEEHDEALRVMYDDGERDHH